MLVSLSNSYSGDEISVGNSKHSSCPTYTVYWLLQLLTTNLYPNFGLRRPFSSKLHLKDYSYSSVWTDHKGTCSIRLILEKSIEHIHKRWYIWSTLVGFNIIKQLDFSYLTSIPLELSVYLFFLTLGVLPMVKDEKRIREKELSVWAVSEYGIEF